MHSALEEIFSYRDNRKTPRGEQQGQLTPGKQGIAIAGFLGLNESYAQTPGCSDNSSRRSSYKLYNPSSWEGEELRYVVFC
jgi:hypothetical protein